MFFIIYFSAMKKSLFSVALLLGLIMFAGCGNKTTTDTTNGEETVVTNETSQEKFESTMMDVYKKWGKMTCTMTSTEAGVEMKGTLYIDGKTMRSDVNWSMQGMKFEMSTIVKDGYSYTRNNLANEWWKMAFEDDNVEEGLNDASTDTDVNSPMSFDCVKGLKKSDAFDLPSNITFQEMNY